MLDTNDDELSWNRWRKPDQRYDATERDIFRAVDFAVAFHKEGVCRVFTG